MAKGKKSLFGSDSEELDVKVEKEIRPKKEKYSAERREADLKNHPKFSKFKKEQK